MTASAGNGFMNTNYKTCAGTPFTFHAEYNTAAQQNQVPWAALEGGVLMQQEIGHSEVCASLANKDPVNDPGLIVDKNTLRHLRRRLGRPISSPSGQGRGRLQPEYRGLQGCHHRRHDWPDRLPEQ